MSNSSAKDLMELEIEALEEQESGLEYSDELQSEEIESVLTEEEHPHLSIVEDNFDDEDKTESSVDLSKFLVHAEKDNSHLVTEEDDHQEVVDFVNEEIEGSVEVENELEASTEIEASGEIEEHTPESIIDTEVHAPVAETPDMEESVAIAAATHFDEEDYFDEEDDEILDEIPPFLPEELEGLTGVHLANALSVYLKRIDRLDKKLKQLKSLKQVLSTHRDVLRPLRNLENLKNLDELENLDKLSALKKIDQLKKLENLDQLENLKKIDNLKQLDALSNLKSLDQLGSLRSLDNLDKLSLLDNLDKLDDLDKLKNLDRLAMLDSDKFIKKMEKLDKLAIINKKFSTFVMAQMIGLILDVLKFGCAAAMVFFLLSSEMGRKYTAESLTAIGFGSPAQSSLGLMLLQGQVEEPKFNEIIENVRNRIKAEIYTALSIGNSLGLSQRARILEETLTYNYQYKDINLKEEALQMAQKQILDAKNLVLPKIQFDIAMAKNHGNKALEKQLVELKTLFINKKYTEIITRFGNSKHKEESVKLATIVATLEMQMQDPTTLQQVITP